MNHYFNIVTQYNKIISMSAQHLSQKFDIEIELAEIILIQLQNIPTKWIEDAQSDMLVRIQETKINDDQDT